MGHPSRNMEDFVAEGDLNSGNLVIEISEEKNFSMCQRSFLWYSREKCGCFLPLFEESAWGKDEEIYINSGTDNVLDATVKVYEMLGAEVFLYFTVEGFDITVRVNPRTTARPGDTIKIALDVNKIHVFDKETEKTITN